MQEYISLLKNLVNAPSLSREEQLSAQVIRDFLNSRHIRFHASDNNTWVFNRYFDKTKPVILLNSHVDTVRPAPGWTKNPFSAEEEGDRITGLGSNDAGGAVVALLATFLHFYDREGLPYNLIFSATAEEEISGERGAQSILNDIQPVHFAIVGEPTGMQLAIAEKGLMVLDCTVKGKAGHAARDEGENAIYSALGEIIKLRNFRFDKVSDVLGPVKLTVTQIEAGTQHNVIPDLCRFVVDVRTNEYYSNGEILEIISGIISAEVIARSTRLNSSGVELTHPFVVRAGELGIRCFGSPTTSDQAIMPWPSVKIGPGDSSRSHTANEFILKNEIRNGIQLYIKLLEDLHLGME